jgi:hypothetical protein
MEEVMYRMAVGHCIDVVREMAGKNNDVGRMYNILRKRVLRAKAKEQESKADIAVSD